MNPTDNSDLLADQPQVSPLPTALAARAAMQRGELTAQALLEQCVQNIEALNPVVNALVSTNVDAAREAARQADLAAAQGRWLGPLHGLPVAIKDIQDIAGLATTWGSPARAQNVARTDSGIVARIRDAGALLIGKTNVPELSIGANTVNPLFGATGNPFAPELTCGGSSGGSAVAVSAAMAPLATGSDHGGSLRIPACYSGVVGVRPTPGVVPNEQRAFPHTHYAVQGPMARTVADAALLLSVISQRDARSALDPMVFPFDAATLATTAMADCSSLRVGYSVDLGGVLVSGEVQQQFEARIRAIAPLVATCVPCALDLTAAPEIDWHLRQELFAAAYAEDAAHWDDSINPNVRATYESAIQTPMQDIALAKKKQLELIRHTSALYEEVDVILTPGVSVPPFPWRSLNPEQIDGRPVSNYMSWLELSSAFTVVGHPVVALPCGTDEQGLPFGIQVIGSRFKDASLLATALALETAFAQDALLAAPAPDLQWLRGQEAGCRDYRGGV